MARTPASVQRPHPKPASVLWCPKKDGGQGRAAWLGFRYPTILRTPPNGHSAGRTPSPPCVVVRLVLRATLRKVIELFYWVFNLIFYRLIIVMIFLVDYML